MKSLLKRVYNVNPLLTKSCLFEYTRINEDLEIKIDQHITQYGETVEFSFKLNGEYIGGCDQELGGSISMPGTNSADDDDFTLMDRCTKRVQELWPTLDMVVEAYINEK